MEPELIEARSFLSSLYRASRAVEEITYRQFQVSFGRRGVWGRFGSGALVGGPREASEIRGAYGGRGPPVGPGQEVWAPPGPPRPPGVPEIPGETPVPPEGPEVLPAPQAGPSPPALLHLGPLLLLAGDVVAGAGPAALVRRRVLPADVLAVGGVGPEPRVRVGVLRLVARVAPHGAAQGLLRRLGQVVVGRPPLPAQHLGGLRPAEAGPGRPGPPPVLLPRQVPRVHRLAAVPVGRGGRPTHLGRGWRCGWRWWWRRWS